MNKQKKEILEFIKTIRQSFSDASIIYNYGACYWLYEILKHIYPKCEWYMYNREHILCKIGEDFYDIEWVVIPDKWYKTELMTEEDHYIASSWKDGQRVENMIRKYNNR